MKPEIIELLEALRALEAGDDIKYDADGYLQDPRVDVIVGLANVALIADHGPDREAMAELRQHGYVVSRGDHDSCGWLTGVIHTGKGEIVYG